MHTSNYKIVNYEYALSKTIAQVTCCAIIFPLTFNYFLIETWFWSFFSHYIFIAQNWNCIQTFSEHDKDYIRFDILACTVSQCPASSLTITSQLHWNTSSLVSISLLQDLREKETMPNHHHMSLTDIRRNKHLVPKSASFKSPSSLIRRFCGLRSLCSTLLAWQYSSPRSSWYKKSWWASGREEENITMWPMEFNN